MPIFAGTIPSPVDQYKIGFVYMSIVLLNFTIQMIAIAGQSIIDIKLRCRKKKAKNNKPTERINST